MSETDAAETARDRGEAEAATKAGSAEGFVTGAGVTAGVIVLFLFLRILAVSDWNWEVAAEIAESFDFDDAVPIVFGTLFERPYLTGAIVTLVMPLALFRIFIMQRRDSLRLAFTDVLVVVCLVATQIVLVRSFSLWWTVIAPVAITVALVIVFLIVHKRGGRGWMTRLGKHAGSILVLAILFLAVTVKTPWSPEETIETDSGTIKGYVLETTPGFVRVLTVDREVKILNDSEIKRRTPGH